MTNGITIPIVLYTKQIVHFRDSAKLFIQEMKYIVFCTSLN
ncbi:hypothetical protein HMPREF9372_2587 [Sporosarcina newyorkensis 2681]|uniref:Uncharacterized protein n=1 Tax=Sporosarcina newyorkensis 2681 TaxID=1027292 RepID=F9DUV6_9BACL|nr:hypothetical protein HMPREF9372_2587 [Sporosarcina newyorkensis 2681]